MITQQLWPASLIFKDSSFYGNTAFYIKLSETDCVSCKTLSDWIAGAVILKKKIKKNIVIKQRVLLVQDLATKGLPSEGSKFQWNTSHTASCLHLGSLHLITTMSFSCWQHLQALRTYRGHWLPFES